MKVIATGYRSERLIIDDVDAFTASMTASVLNECKARRFLNLSDRTMSPYEGWWFYSSKPDDYAVPMGAET